VDEQEERRRSEEEEEEVGGIVYETKQNTGGFSTSHGCHLSSGPVI